MNLFAIIFLIVISFIPASKAWAEDLTCRKGTPAQALNYRSSVELLQKAERLTPEQEEGVLKSLERAAEDQCKNAALVLFEIKANQAAALSLKTRGPALDKLEDEQYSLLLKANQIGEGFFELGSFYLAKGSKYYSPKKAVNTLEIAAKAGDEKSIELLVSIYENGIGGIGIDLVKANSWKQKMKN